MRGRHVEVETWFSPEPKRARENSHREASSGAASVLRTWLIKSGANADTGRSHYRRRGNECREHRGTP